MENKQNKPTYWSLFVQMLALSTFTIGGGYVMISLMNERFVQRRGWLNSDELSEIMVLGQSAPGALVVNTAAIMGYRLLGFWGAICAVCGTALPAIVILALASYFYEYIRDNVYVSAAFRGMRAGVAAVVADLVVNMAAPYFSRGSTVYAIILVTAFLISFLFSVNVAFIILGCGILGVILGIIQRRRRKTV